MLYPIYGNVSSGKLVLRHSVSIKTVPFPTFSLIRKVLRVEWRNSTPRNNDVLFSTQEQEYEWGNPLATSLPPVSGAERALARAAHRWRTTREEGKPGAFSGILFPLFQSRNKNSMGLICYRVREKPNPAAFSVCVLYI